MCTRNVPFDGLSMLVNTSKLHKSIATYTRAGSPLACHTRYMEIEKLLNFLDISGVRGANVHIERGAIF